MSCQVQHKTCTKTGRVQPEELTRRQSKSVQGGTWPSQDQVAKPISIHGRMKVCNASCRRKLTPDDARLNKQNTGMPHELTDSQQTNVMQASSNSERKWKCVDTHTPGLHKERKRL